MFGQAGLPVLHISAAEQLPRRQGNAEECEVMVDQSRAIDNRRITRSLKALPRPLMREVESKLRKLAEL